MKKYSWINYLLVTAILMTSFISLFAVGVVAADADGAVIKTFTFGTTDYNAYAYSDDQTAITAGMIARAEVTVDATGTAKTGYFKTIADMCAVSGQTDTNDIAFPTAFQFIVSEVQYDSNTDIKFDAGDSSITLTGATGGTTVTAPNGGRFLLTAKGANGFVMENINLKSDASAKATVVQIQASSKLTLNNCTVSSTAEKKTALVVVQKNASLTLNAGTKLVSATGCAEGMVNGGVLVNQAGATVTVNAGVEIDTAGVCIYAKDNNNVTINGGELGGSGITAVVHADNNGNITINGGTFVNKNTASNMYGMVIAGSGSKNGGTVTVNGGTFLDATGTATVIFRTNSSKDSLAKVTVNSATVCGGKAVFIGDVGGGDANILPATMQTGASVRTVADSSGIRFQSEIAKTAIESAKAKAYDGNCTVGTLIVPYDYLVNANGEKICDFTKEALTSAGKQYIDVVAVNGLNDNGDTYLVNAAMTDIKTANYTRDFVAVAYITYQTAEGKTITAYGTWSETDNVRNIREVAYSALADVKAVGDTVGETEITAENYSSLGLNQVTEWYEYDKTTGVATLKTGVAYSPYSTDQRAVLKQYIVQDS